MTSIWIWIGLALSVGYLSFLVYLGKRGGSVSVDSINDYFVAGGSLGSLLIFLTMIGSAFSSGTFLGAMGLAYSGGLTGVLSIGGIVIADAPALIMIGEKIWKISNNGNDYVTPADLMSDRYDDSSIVRILIAAISSAFTFFYIVVQFVGMGLVLTVLSDGLISRRLAIVFIGLFMMTYIAIGGMRGVVYTDAFQSVMLWVGMLTVAVWVVIVSPENVYVSAANQMESVLTIKDPIYLYTVAVGYGLSVITYPYLWQRFFSAKNHSSIWAVGLGEALPMVILSAVVPIVAGFAGIVMYPGLTNPDNLILKMVFDMPGPLLGVIMVAALAASMSSADSQILLVGSIIVRDIFQSFPIVDVPEKKMTTYSKLISGVVTIAALLVSLLDLGQLMDIVIQVAVPGFLLLLPPLVAAFWWPEANKYGVTAGLIMGLSTAIYYLSTGASVPYGVWVGLPGLAVCSLSIVVVSLATPSPDKDRVEKFVYELRELDPDDLEGTDRSPTPEGSVSTDD